MSGAPPVPIFPLRTVLFPGGPLPLRIFETRYVDMVRRCMRSNSPFVVAAIRTGSETGAASFHGTATLARIRDFETLPGGLLGVLAVGEHRVRVITQQKEADGLNVGVAEPLPPEPACAVPDGYDDLASLAHDLLEQMPAGYYREQSYKDATWLGYRLVETLPLALVQKQYFLELEDALHRLDVLRAVLESMQILPRPR